MKTTSSWLGRHASSLILVMVAAFAYFRLLRSWSRLAVRLDVLAEIVGELGGLTPEDVEGRIRERGWNPDLEDGPAGYYG